MSEVDRLVPDGPWLRRKWPLVAGAAVLTVGLCLFGGVASGLIGGPNDSASPVLDATRAPSKPTPKSTPFVTRSPTPNQAPTDQNSDAGEPGTDGSSSSGGGNNSGGTKAPPVVVPPPPPVVVPPPPPPVVVPPPPPPVDHTPRLTHNGNYKPGCGGMTFTWSQETSQGGGIIITMDYKYDVTTYPTSDGYGVKVYICTDQS